MMRFILLFLLTVSVAYAHDESTAQSSLSDKELEEAVNQLLQESAYNSRFQDDKTDYESYDKRQVFYNEWEYVKIENDFDNRILKVARLFSNDGNAILFITYKMSDKQLKNPDVGLQLSGDFDSNGYFHNFLCTQNCLNIDMNVDGKKHQNISMAYGGSRILVAKNPKIMLNHIKNGETIKIRLQSVTGDPLVYVFEPNIPLDLQELKDLQGNRTIKMFQNHIE